MDTNCKTPGYYCEGWVLEHTLQHNAVCCILGIHNLAALPPATTINKTFELKPQPQPDELIAS